MGQFKPMPRMETTEPSVILKLKKGGTVKKADGGALPIRTAPGRVAGAMAPAQAAEMAKARGRASLMGAPAMARPAPGIPSQAMGRKSGGSVGNEKAEIRRVKAELKENRKEERNEHEEIGRVKKELKAHKAMKASAAHKGYATGGVISKDGSKTGTVEQFRGGYKKGGKACMADGGVPAGVGMSLTPATRDVAEKVRTESTVSPTMRPVDQPTAKELEMLREAAADAKAAAEAERAYNKATGKKTGGAMKKYATGGVVKGYKSGGACMSSGGAAGFSEMKKMKNW